MIEYNRLARAFLSGWEIGPRRNWFQKSRTRLWAIWCQTPWCLWVAAGHRDEIKDQGKPLIGKITSQISLVRLVYSVSTNKDRNNLFAWPHLNKKPFAEVGPLNGPGIKGTGIVNNLLISNPLPPVVTLSGYVDENAGSLPVKGKLVDDEQRFVKCVDLCKGMRIRNTRHYVFC